MQTIDLTEVSSDEDRSVPPSKSAKRRASSLENGISVLTNGKDEDDTRGRAAFLLETAGRASISRSPASPRRKSASPPELRPRAMESLDLTPTRHHLDKPPRIRTPTTPITKGKPKMARKAVVDSRLAATSSSSHSVRELPRKPQPKADPPPVPQSLTIREPHGSPVPAKPSISPSTSNSGTIKLSLASIENATRESLREMQADHKAHVQSLLSAARFAASSPTSRPNSSRSSPSFAEQLRALKKPSFSSMKPIGTLETALSKKKHIKSSGLLTISSDQVTQSWVCPFTLYSDTQRITPPFSNYISIRTNVLSKEDDSRTYLPYNGDGFTFNPDSDYHKLEEKIGNNRKNFERTAAMTERARLWVPYASDLLTRTGCSPRNIIEFLGHGRDADFPPRELPSESAKSWKHFKGMYRKDQKQLGEAPLSVAKMLEILPDRSTGRQLAFACTLNHAFIKITGTDLYSIFEPVFVRSVEIPEVSADTKGAGLRLFDTYTRFECLVCNAHDCPGHGEFEEEHGVSQRGRVSYSTTAKVERKAKVERQRGGQYGEQFLGVGEDGTISGPEWVPLRRDDQPFDNETTCSDVCFWNRQNRRNRTVPSEKWSPEERHAFEALYLAYRNDLRGPCMMAQLGIGRKTCVDVFHLLVEEYLDTPDLPPHLDSRNDASRLPWRKPASVLMMEHGPTAKSHLHHERQPFTPCNHPGSCDAKSGCLCAKLEIVCEKTCSCSNTCHRKFGGCRCAAKGKVCRENDRCECWALNRECDPELCLSCGAHDILDPANRRRDDIAHGRCANVVIQRGVPKRTILGISKIMADSKEEGLGLYIGEAVRKGDFIDEYVGEIVTDNEAHRREAVYDKRNMSYLFDLNATQAVDSTHMGNKSRFINSEIDEPNVQAKVLFCNGVQRIGMFAARTINPGEELSFNYGGNFSKKFTMSKGRAATKGRLPAAAAAAAAPVPPRLSKNGFRIGRPPKNPAVLAALQAAAHRPLSVASASTGRASRVSLGSSARGTPRSSTVGTPRSTRKRRRGELEGEEGAEEEPEPELPPVPMFDDDDDDETSDHSVFAGGVEESTDDEDEVANLE